MITIEYSSGLIFQFQGYSAKPLTLSSMQMDIYLYVKYMNFFFVYILFIYLFIYKHLHYLCHLQCHTILTLLYNYTNNTNNTDNSSDTYIYNTNTKYLVCLRKE